jgi:hypothetical protein
MIKKTIFKLNYKKEVIKRNSIKALTNYTMAKFLGALTTITMVALVKYIISGSLHIEYSNFLQNISLGLLGWTINTGIVGALSVYFGIKGIDFNIYQLLFGFNTMKVGEIPELLNEKDKLYNAMEASSPQDSNSEIKSSSGKKSKGYNPNGRDVRVHPYPRNGRRLVRSWHFDYNSDNDSNKNNLSDNGSDVEMELEPSNTNTKSLLQDKGKTVVSTDEEPSSVIWTRVFTGLEPKDIFPIGINPAPGFNVPGGEVPLTDDICKYINHNSHILNQFKNMELGVAKKQVDNYLLCLYNINSKLAYAESVLNKIPLVPTNNYEFNIKNKILWEIEKLNNDKAQIDAKVTLLRSRIDFINANKKN